MGKPRAQSREKLLSTDRVTQPCLPQCRGAQSRPPVTARAWLMGPNAPGSLLEGIRPCSLGQRTGSLLSLWPLGEGCLREKVTFPPLHLPAE